MGGAVGDAAHRRTNRRLSRSGEPWWKRAVIYHVYPRSFADENGDGVGDLRGVIEHLDHLRWLGVDALWLSPVYLSPMKDFGYDIADHTAVDPLFGTNEDLDELIARAHELGLRVLLDYVPNHTSDGHPWFVAARASRTGERREWYLWRDPAPGGGPPNNWLSVFGGPAWTADETTGQYYYHAYLTEQPDLNWRHPPVRAAMLDVLRFWLDRGVDGFRVDAMRQLLKDPLWRDNPRNPDYAPGQPPYESMLSTRSADADGVFEPIKAMREVVRAYDRPGRERLLVGEVYLPFERLMRYYGRPLPARAGGQPDGDGVHLPTNMHLIGAAWRPEALAAMVERYEALLPPYGWPNWVLGNHDRPRVASRIGRAQARVAAMLLLTLRGTPTLYYGDEIGMRDVPIPPERVRDPYARNVPGIGVGRDPERTPMQWSDRPHAGFCPPGAHPWLPVAEDFALVNVAAQRRDPASTLNLHRRLLALRRATPALVHGGYRTVRADAGVYVYLREGDGRGGAVESGTGGPGGGGPGGGRMLIALNLTGAPRQVELDAVMRPGGLLRLSTMLDREDERVGAELRLRADEGVIVDCGSVPGGHSRE